LLAAYFVLSKFVIVFSFLFNVLVHSYGVEFLRHLVNGGLAKHQSLVGSVEEEEHF